MKKWVTSHHAHLSRGLGLVILTSHIAYYACPNSCVFQNPEVKKRRTFKKFTYRGVDLDQLLDMGDDQLKQLFNARQRRRIERGHKRKHMALLRRLRKAKKEAPPMEKPEAVKTHLRDMIIVPEMTGSIVGIHNGKGFTGVEIKVSRASN